MAEHLSSGEKSKKMTARWTTEMVSELIKCLKNYKAKMSYNGIDFDADRPLQYRDIRKSMAKIYKDVKPSFFGPLEVSTSQIPLKELSKAEKEEFMKNKKRENELITKGHSRIHKKIKEIRQNFAKAVTSGTRSGSGKVVFEFYDDLCVIWGGSPASEPLPFGVDTKSFADNCEEDTAATDNETVDQIEGGDEIMPCGEEHEDVGASKPSLKRATTSSSVPRLIDNKRKHLERSLSATQRDTILMNEAKDDKELKRDFVKVMQESKDSFKAAMDGMSGAMIQLAQGFSHSMEMLSQSLVAGQQPMNQNLFYQNSTPQYNPQFQSRPGQSHYQQGQEYQFAASNHSQSQETFARLMKDTTNEDYN